MRIDRDKLEDLRGLLKKAYIEGYHQGMGDREMFPLFRASVEERWAQSEILLYLEIVEKGYEV